MKSRLLLFIIFLCLNGFSQEFTDGYYINLQHDTVYCKIQTYSSKKLSKQDYNRIVVQVDSLTTKTLTPQDIVGYYKNGNTFKSFYLQDINLHYFAKLVVEGDVTVWEKISTPENSFQLYVLKKKTDTNYVIMSITGNQVRVREGVITTISITKNELYWTAVLYLYFQDCESITTKMRIGYYTSADFISIAKEYNSCNKKTTP